MIVEFKKYDDEIIAFFPYDNKGNNITSYQHIGQHAEASSDFMRDCKVAAYDEYKPLYDELISIGYENLTVYNQYC